MRSYYEATIRGIMKKDISYKTMNEEMARAINYCLLHDEELKELHKKNCFKFYTFSGLVPVSKNGYRKNEIYSFTIRSINEAFLSRLTETLKITDLELMQIRSVSFEEKRIGKIEQLYTLTPVISVMEQKKHWTKDNYSMCDIIERINMNAQKKYKEITGQNIDKTHNLIKFIEQKNDKAIVCDYKGGKLLGNKFQIHINEDELSQDLAFLVFSSGILEKNALGFGFTLAR